MRGHRRAVLPFLLAAACGGDNLTLPGPGQPAVLRIVSGDGQSATVGEPVPQPLVVRLLDGDSLPVSGRMVVFRFGNEAPDGAVNPTSSSTDADGLASATARLGSLPGDQPIDAQVVTPGQDLLVRFRLTAVPTPPATGGSGNGGGGGNHSPPPSGGGSGGGGGDGHGDKHHGHGEHD
jgi:hypothetical protein